MDKWTLELKATAAARGWLATAAVALSTLAELGPAAGRLSVPGDAVAPGEGGKGARSACSVQRAA